MEPPQPFVSPAADRLKRALVFALHGAEDDVDLAAERLAQLAELDPQLAFDLHEAVMQHVSEELAEHIDPEAGLKLASERQNCAAA